MIIVPSTKYQWDTLARFLELRAGVQPSADLRMIAWITDDDVKMVVGLDGFIGKVCRIHVGMVPEFKFTPKAMLEAVFEFTFGNGADAANRDMVIGIVNSKNSKAMRYDLHLGFKEAHRFIGVHDDGGDMVLLTMSKQDCKYIQQERAA